MISAAEAQKKTQAFLESLENVLSIAEKNITEAASKGDSRCSVSVPNLRALQGVIDSLVGFGYQVTRMETGADSGGGILLRVSWP